MDLFFCKLLAVCVSLPLSLADVLYGVHPDDLARFNPQEDFKCKDDSTTIPYGRVNDNFCDCPDGSDEPSTSACERGVFYCVNQGHVGLYIPSSRVNEGTCDCCDGSDEYLSQSCPDNCLELSKAVHRELVSEFFTDDELDDENLGIVHAGMEKRLEMLAEFRKLAEEHGKTARLASELEMQAKMKERLAHEALETYRCQAKGKKCETDSEKEESVEGRYVHEAFVALDLNKDGILNLMEIQSEKIFDLNKNGEVEDQEVKWYYDVLPALVNEDVFREKMWKKIGRLYVLEKELEKAMALQFNEDDDESQVEVADTEEESQTQGSPSSEDSVLDMIPVLADEKTRAAVKDVAQARRKLGKVQQKMESLREKKFVVEKTLKEEAEKIKEGITPTLDNFGPEEKSKYFGSKNHCYRYTDQAHTYILCPFNSVRQEERYRKGLGVSLGVWEGWGREKGEPVMIYKNGKFCQEVGRSRLTRVRIFCGTQNLLVHVSEPRTCEYSMDFKSPAGCHIRNLKDANFTLTSHDEL
ncbi:unnamed protein product [Nesidiocoris tenuis]|uniref:Glucosidase 2 subunit beta n=1 Tax=Nesidiocoris tenuis TaxID=355587 RepID=A0A6H5H4J7_9HEMI|nr:unnamed protein product [Nesidiocoris tenuis]